MEKNKRIYIPVIGVDGKPKSKEQLIKELEEMAKNLGVGSKDTGKSK